MIVARTFFTLILCAVCVVRGDQAVPAVTVGGDVPKPGPVKFEGEGMTMDSAMAGVGMDLEPYYAKGHRDNDASRCPIRVMVIRRGQKTVYDPSVDVAVLRSLQLELNDTIAVTDFRQHPKRIEAGRRRIDRMIELGSTEIVNELFSLAALQFDYDKCLSNAGEHPEDSVASLKEEAARLAEEGKGQRILDILDLKLSALQLEGLGKAHPAIKSTTSLIEIFRDLAPK